MVAAWVAGGRSPRRFAGPGGRRLGSAPTSDDEATRPAIELQLGNDTTPPRMAALEAAVVRLKGERATDADYIAAMLVRVSEAERERVAAAEHASALGEELEHAQTRTMELEAQAAEA